MNNDYLITRNKLIRDKRPLISDDKKYSIYENNGTFQICFKSKGCRYYLNGFCIMCDYGKGINITKEELEMAFDEAIKKSKYPIRTILLNSFGSILDTSEISEECFKVLLYKLKQTDVNNIIFETHYTTITKDKLFLIKEKLQGKKIRFELGLESSNNHIRENCLLKYIDNDLLTKKIDLIHSFDMGVITNLLIGTPFLSEKEQLEDSLNSIIWCFKNGADEVDIFPINIKPYTILKELYENKKYNPISHWLVIELLNRVPSEYISDIYLAWYGNRKLEYENGEQTILPQSCPRCHDDIMNFYSNFLSNSDQKYRKHQINSLISNRKCDCYEKVLKKI